MEEAARALGMQLLAIEIRGPDDLENAFETARTKRADALLIPAGGFLALYRKRILDLAAQSQLPAIGSDPRSAEEGSLLTYGPSIAEPYRRAATYVNKILKGAKPWRFANRETDGIRAGSKSEDGKTARNHNSRIGAVSC